MYNRAYNTDFKYRLHKLSVGKGNLKLRLQHSKRNNSKNKNKLNNLSINNDKNMNNSKIKNNNSLINKNKNTSKDHSKDNKSQKIINARSKVLSITANNNELINFNNYLKNDDTNEKINNDTNTSNNENINNSYIHITLNSNNPYVNQNIVNIIEEKKNNKKNPISGDAKYNITVNKIGQNNDQNSTKERNSIREQNKNRVIKKVKRDLSAKPREDNFIFNKKLSVKEKNNSNYHKKKNYSPLIDSNEPKYSSKISNLIHNNNNHHHNLHFYSHNTQKMKNNISNINTISFNNNISNYNSNNSNIINNNTMNTLTNEEEYFEYNNDKNIELTKDEKLIYGDRIMKGYTKKKLLGKGGCGIVWLCTKSNKSICYEYKKNYRPNYMSFRKENDDINFNNNDISYEQYAVKQTTKKNGNALINMANENINIAKNEIKILYKLNNSENNSFIPKIYDYYEDNNDLWFSFEKGGISISGLSFKIKGEFEKGERIYYIQKGKFLMSLFSTISQFKFLLKSLLSAIDYINKKGIIHSDIKPENILIEYTGDSNGNNFEIKSIKIIDYGSAFFANNTAAISSNTPEYLCPEITIGNKKFIKELKNNNLKYINCIDIWSLGITILELCLCCPSWMSYKTKVIINGKTFHPSGLFGCRGRDANKIYQKQIDLSKNINKKLKNSMLYLFNQNDRNNFIDLLKKMLEFDYRKRINCQDAINHPFFK
jgi:serine/threonine protein kinase